MTTARIEAAARADFNLSRGLEADDPGWDEIHGDTRTESLARGAAIVAAIDAADDRIRLTLPEFHAIKADAVHDLSHALHMSWDAESRTAAQAAGVPDFIEQYRATLADRFIDPPNHEAAMASLVRERLAAVLRATAESFDHASLSDITGAMDIPPGVSARYKRIMISGCADWLRTRADDLDAEGRIPYYRVTTRALIDDDRHTALLRVLGQVIDRSQQLAKTDRITTPFILTDLLVEAIEGVGATLPQES